MSGSHAPASPVVVKFGGTSLATPRRVRLAASRLASLQAGGRAVVAVVSAAAGTTDRILDWLGEMGAPGDAARESDRALATGEALSAALLATALAASGTAARSLTGGEAGLRARGPFGAGELCRLDGAAIASLLAGGVIPVVAGFQARVDSGETVTLGRGASDLTAVFLSAHLPADECHIVTDVDGVHMSDPRLHRSARRIPVLSHEELCGLAHAGAKVVQGAAAELARDHRVRLRIYHYRAPVDRPGGTTVVSPAEGAALKVSA